MTTRTIHHIVVHCSATPNGRRVTAKDIDYWHRQRGYLRIGYHYVIGVDGTVEQGRPESEPGAHVQGHNTNSIGICLVGGLDAKGRPSAAYAPVQWTALERLIRELLDRYTNAEVLGHRDFPGVRKDCPCFDVRSWWAERNQPA